MARAIVLSAGFGTRLRPLSAERPKALVPIGDRPLAYRIAERLERAGFSEVVMNTHHLSDAFPPEISEFPIKVHLVREPHIRGTAGGIAGARHLLGPAPIIAWNVDILADAPVAALVARAHEDALCFAVAPRPAFEGTVGVGDDGRIVRLRGKSFGREISGGDYIGVAALGAVVLDTLPVEGCLVGDVALPRLERDEPVFAVPATARWRDVGSLAEYVAGNLEWLSDAHGAGASWVHPTARLSSGVRLERSIVGAHAVVEGTGVLARTIVWPGASVQAPLEDAIVTTAGAVVRP